MRRSLLLIGLVLVPASADAETWATNTELMKERSGGSCPGTAGDYSLDLTGNVFAATTQSGKMFSITLPADGAVKHQFKSPSGLNFEIVGNAKSKDLELVNTRYGCRFKLTPK